MEIIEYFSCDRKEHMLSELRKCEWEAGKLLYSLLKSGNAEQFLGKNPRVLMLTDGNRLVSFCTFARKDDIPDCELSPWIGFVYTFPEYRGHRYIGRLIAHAEIIAGKEGCESIFISTDHTGLYEKYGYTFREIRKDINGCDSRIYEKQTAPGECKMHDKIKEYIYSKKEYLLSVTDALVSIPSVKGEPLPGAPFGEMPKRALDKMTDICKCEGFITKQHYDVVGTADLMPESQDEMPALGILGHLDVVPAEGQEGWLTDPFTMTEKDGILYGRGVIDDKGPLCAALLAMKCIKELNIPLKKGVRLIFGTDEENGSEDLAIYTANEKLPPYVFTPDASFPIINIEKGMMRSRFSGISGTGSIVRFHGGSIPNAVPDKAECVIADIPAAIIEKAVNDDKSGAYFDISVTGSTATVKCTGRSAHASTPESGINAVTALISLLCELPLKDCGQTEILRGLKRIFPFGETDGEHTGLKASDKRSGALTLVFSIFDMENGSCSGCIDVRFPVCLTLSDVEEAERSALGSAGCQFDGFMGDEPHITDENSDFVRKLLTVYERCEREKGRCIAIGGGTYVHNIPGGVAFGVERGDTDYNMHGANEYITADELLKDAVIFAEAIAEICG